MTHQTQPVRLNRRYPPAPLVGVAAAVFNAAGEVLLVQRAAPPRQGQWGLPGGLLDLGERLRDGVQREVHEECGIQIEVGDIVATFEPIQYDADGRVEYHYVVIDFWARHVDGQAIAADDAAAVAWANPHALDAFALSADTHGVVRKAHAAWRAATA